MIRRKGSSLIESLVSLFLLYILIFISVKTSIVLYKSTINRAEINNRNNTIYAIINEIKYNIEFDYLNEKLNQGDLFIGEPEYILEKLTYVDIKELVNSSYGETTISKVEDIEGGIKVNIKIKHNDKLLEEEFIKGWWMDEI